MEKTIPELEHDLAQATIAYHDAQRHPMALGKDIEALAEQLKRNPYDESATTIPDTLRRLDVLTVRRQRYVDQVVRPCTAETSRIKNLIAARRVERTRLEQALSRHDAHRVQFLPGAPDFGRRTTTRDALLTHHDAERERIVEAIRAIAPHFLA